MRLCPVEAVEEGEGKGFAVGEGIERKLIFVVRWEDALKGYINSCPHVGTPLDWVRDKFFAPDDRHLICATHGALFQPEDGLCVVGPCEGESLIPVTLEIEDGWIIFREQPRAA